MKNFRIILLFLQVAIGLYLLLNNMKSSTISNYNNNYDISEVPPGKRVSNNMSPHIKQELSQALSSVNDAYAAMVLDSLTEIEVYSQNFLPQYQIYKVEYFNPHHPIVFYVAYAPSQAAYLLTGNTANYFELAKADNVVIDSPLKAAEYAKTYLEVTRSMSSLSYVIKSVTDVEFRSDLEGDELSSKLAFISKYVSVITEPTGKFYVDDYLVTAYMVDEQAVNEYTITVKQNGEIMTDSKTLEPDLPLVYGL